MAMTAPTVKKTKEDNTSKLPSLLEDFAKAVSQTYALLSTAQDLSPNNKVVAQAIEDLIKKLTQCQSPEIVKALLAAPELKDARKHLPDLCAKADCETEKYWTREMLKQPISDLSEYFNFPRYKELCRAEFDLFKDHSFGRISFLGSGAMPMTAFMLAQMYPDVPIVCVDYDEEACKLSRQLCEKFGLQDRVTILHMKALDYIPADNELVFCAALLEGKKDVYKHLDQYNSALIVRDAEGPYQYVYKAAELPRAHFQQVAKTEIDTRRINTSRFYIHKPELEHARPRHEPSKKPGPAPHHCA
jgi:hypothetical protein